MSNILAGYDMVVAITQNEVNSQFARMSSPPEPVINTYVTANGLSSGWGGSDFLSSYIRGYVDPPTVQFRDPASPDSHDHVFFQATFRARNLSPDELAGLGLDTSALSYPQGGTGSDGYLLKREDVPSKQGTLSGQAIYYWLRATGTVGTIKTWALVPVVYFLSEGVHALVNLDGLQVSFKVMLSMLPTTPAEVEDLVDQGIMPPSVLQTITANGFNQAAFSLQRLFLDFDTVDFTQWALKPVDGSTQVDVILVEPNQYLSQSLTSLTQNNQDFISNFSTALQYAFGMNGQNTDGATPYILGINAQSNHPATTNPGAPPSLVPTYIGFGASANATDEGLDTLNYQVLAGDNSQARVPRTGDGSVVYVTDTLVTNNDYSGSLLFAKSAFFEPLVLQPIQQAFGAAPSLWTTQGTTMTVTDSGHIVELNNEQTILGEGLKQKVTMDSTQTCTVTVSGNTINISGSYYQRQDITISLIVLTEEIPFHWWMWCTVSFQQQITLAVDAQNQLVFNMGPMTTTTDGPHEDENFGGELVNAVSEAFEVLSMGYFDPMEDALDTATNALAGGLQSRVAGMNTNLTAGMASNFISPTGDVFFLNAPRFNGDLDLLMDVTYRV